MQCWFIIMKLVNLNENYDRYKEYHDVNKLLSAEKNFKIQYTTMKKKLNKN